MQQDNSSLQEEVDHLFVGCTRYKELLDTLASPPASFSNATWSDIHAVEARIRTAQNAITEKGKKVEQIKARRKQLSTKLQEVIEVNLHIEREFNNLRHKVCLLREDENAVEAEHVRLSEQLHRFMQINVLNDAYYIWFSGPFATINGFRVGKLSNFPQVDWPEINAGLGQAALVVSTIAIKAHYEFKKFFITPMGSFAKLTKVDDRRQVFNLYTDGSFSLFASTKKNFNCALIGLLSCVDELGQHVMNLDPTLSLPYEILSTSSDGKINNLSISYGSDEEQWTKSLKFLLTCIKWIIAWSTKHLYYRTTQYDTAKEHLENLRKTHVSSGALSR